MHRLGLIIADHFQMLALSTLTVFEFANLVTESPFYQPEVYSEHGGTVRSSSGIGVPGWWRAYYRQWMNRLARVSFTFCKPPPARRAGLPGSAPGHLYWHRPGCWSKNAPLRTGHTHTAWLRDIPLFSLKMIVFLLLMTLSGHRLA